MAPTASVRELRHQFPRVKKLVEQEGARAAGLRVTAPGTQQLKS